MEQVVLDKLHTRKRGDPMTDQDLVARLRTVWVFKMPFRTAHFNANQKVWVKMATGAEAALVVGRYRGKHRYVEAWVNWRSQAKDRPEWKAINVAEAFADRLDLMVAPTAIDAARSA